MNASTTTVVGARRAVADIAVQIIAQAANLALGVVVTALIARGLGTVKFGQWSTILAIGAMAGAFTDLKLQEVTMRQVAAEPSRERQWLGAYTSLRATLSIPVAVIAAGVIVAVSPTREMRLAGLISCIGILFAPLAVGTLLFKQRVRNHINMAAVSLNSVVWAGAVFWIMGRNGGLVPLSVALTACSLGVGLMMFSLARRQTKFALRGSHGMWRSLIRVGAGVGLAGLLTLAYARIDQIIVFQLAPHPSDAGLYGGITRIMTTASFVPIAVMTTIFPLAAAARGRDHDRVRRLVQTAIDYLAMVSLPAFVFCLVAAGPILALLLGPAFAPGANGLRILMAAFIPVCFGYVAGNMVIILGLQRRFINYALVGLTVNVALNLVLVPVDGYIGAAWVTLVTEVVVIVLSLRAVLRTIEMRLAVGRLIRTALAAAILGAMLFALRTQHYGLAVLVPVTLVAWVPLLLMVRSLDIDELRQLKAERRVVPAE